MTEILTWGYAGLNGRKGLIYKAKGIKDGWSAPLEKMEVDRRSLLRGMDHEIPPLDFQFNPYSGPLERWQTLLTGKI